MTTPRPNYFSTALDRGLRVLEAIADVPRIRVEDIASRVNLPVSTVYRYVRQLKDAGYVFEVDGFYSAGARFADSEQRGDTNHLVTLAGPSLRQLSDRSGLTALLSVRVGATLLCLDRHTAHRPTRLTFQCGSVQALYAGCSAEVLLAHAPTFIVEEVLSGPMRAKTARTPSSADLRKRLRKIRQRGFAISKGEINPDAIGVAAPVFRADTCVCVVSAAGPAAVMSGAKLRRTLDQVLTTCCQLIQVLDDTRQDTAWQP